MILFKIGYFDFGSVRKRRNGTNDGDAQTQIIEDVHAMEALLNFDVVASLREIHHRSKIEFSTFLF